MLSRSWQAKRSLSVLIQLRISINRIKGSEGSVVIMRFANKVLSVELLRKLLGKKRRFRVDIYRNEGN